MYTNIKSHYKKDIWIGTERESFRGVRQWDGLSPLLFNIFVNDMHSIFDANPVVLYDMNINCLMYADEVILISESESGLQQCLIALETYSTTQEVN